MLNKGPDSSLMIWQSRVSRGGSGPRGKLMATEEAGAKKNSRVGCKQRGRPGRGCSALAAQVQRSSAAVQKKTVTSLVERAANDSDRVQYKADRRSLTSSPQLVRGYQGLHCEQPQRQPQCESCGWRSCLGCSQMPGFDEASPYARCAREAAHSGTETRDLGHHSCN